MKKNNKFLAGILFAGINALALGSSGIIDKLGSGYFTNSIIFSTQSVLFSLIFVTIFTLFYYKGIPLRELKHISLSSWKNIFFVGILASGLFIIFRFLGLTQSTGTFATIAQVIVTAETAILAMLFLHERLSKTFSLLFIVILIAIYFVSVGRFTISALQKGDIYIIFGATFLAFANIFSKLAVNKVNPLLLAEGRFFFGTLFLLLSSILLFHQTQSLFVFSIWSVLSGFLWAANVVAFNFAIQRIGVTFTTSLLMTAPIITMIFEYFILRQTFNPIQITAAIIVIISGILIVVLKK